ncbi:MAG: post-PEP-CTERM-1 domain-containing protein [Candidatus Binatia bacterium]
MNRSRWLLVAPIGLTGLLLAAPVALPAEDAASSGAMRVYRDPQTGKLTTPPPGAVVEEVAPPTEALTATLPAPLVPFRGTSPAGGVGINVRGLPKPTFQATIAPRGAPVIECVPGAAGRSQ